MAQVLAADQQRREVHNANATPISSMAGHSPHRRSRGKRKPRQPISSPKKHQDPRKSASTQAQSQECEPANSVAVSHLPAPRPSASRPKECRLPVAPDTGLEVGS